jgi:UDP-glucose 4-epimerase
MSVLLLGAGGFIGQHLYRFYSSQIPTLGIVLRRHQDPGNDYLTVRSTPWEFQEDLKQIFQKYPADLCINAAGRGSVPQSFQTPLQDLYLNTFNTAQVLDALRNYQPHCRYLNLSSAAVYGNPQKLPVDETHPVKPLSPYGWHKYHSELLCQQYTQLFDLKTCSVRIFSVYGPGLKKQLFWDIAQKAKAAPVIELFGTGEESRDFIFIGDLVRAIKAVVNHAPMQGEVINVASGQQTLIQEAAQTFLDVLKPSVGLSFNGQVRSGDPIGWQAEISRLKSFGFVPQTSLKDGLHSYTQWLNENELV